MRYLRNFIAQRAPYHENRALLWVAHICGGMFSIFTCWTLALTTRTTGTAGRRGVWRPWRQPFSMALTLGHGRCLIFYVWIKGDMLVAAETSVMYRGDDIRAMLTLKGAALAWDHCLWRGAVSAGGCGAWPPNAGKRRKNRVYGVATVFCSQRRGAAAALQRRRLALSISTDVLLPAAPGDIRENARTSFASLLLAPFTMDEYHPWWAQCDRDPPVVFRLRITCDAGVGGGRAVCAGERMAQRWTSSRNTAQTLLDRAH